LFDFEILFPDATEGATHITGTFCDNIEQWAGLSQELQAH